MKGQFKIWFLVLLIAVFMAGCGCGGGEETPAPTPTLLSITVSPSNPDIVLGSTQQFTATGTFSDNTTQDITTSVTWSSSDVSIATISNAPGSQGLATSLASGSTLITATSGNISASTTLTIKAELVSIEVTPTYPVVTFGATIQFTATGTFSDKTTQDITTSVTWSSSDTSIATISNAAGSQGVATTDHERGISIIKATLGDISGSATLVDP